MRIGFHAKNTVDENGNPTGGVVVGTGVTIAWQDGPLGRPGAEDRKEPNGAFVEDVIDAAKQRLEFFENASGGRFACEENADAIALLEQALMRLDDRTSRRTDAGTEGTHQGS